MKGGMKHIHVFFLENITTQTHTHTHTQTNLVLSEQEGQQHQHASIMDNPPHIDGSLPQAVLVGGETVHILGHK